MSKKDTNTSDENNTPVIGSPEWNDAVAKHDKQFAKDNPDWEEKHGFPPNGAE